MTSVSYYPGSALRGCEEDVVILTIESLSITVGLTESVFMEVVSRAKKRIIILTKPAHPG